MRKFVKAKRSFFFFFLIMTSITSDHDFTANRAFGFLSRTVFSVRITGISGKTLRTIEKITRCRFTAYSRYTDDKRCEQ